MVPIRISLTEGCFLQVRHWTKGTYWLSWSQHFKSFTVATSTEYLCRKWQWTCFSCSKHFVVLCFFMTYHRVCNYNNTTGANSGSGTTHRSGVHGFIPDFYCGSCCTIFSFLCNVLKIIVGSFSFSFSHCVVCPSSMYGIWLPLWCLQTFLVLTISHGCFGPLVLLFLKTLTLSSFQSFNFERTW